MVYPKVLIVSHNCFSLSGSNGRTLANFFDNYPSDKIAQFFIYNEIPSCKICNNYFRITDKDVIKSWFRKTVGKTLENPQQKHEQVLGNSPNGKKTAVKCMLREVLWRISPWKKKQLTNWISQFQPELIVFQAGDAAFMFRFVKWISDHYSIPYVIYNSESYYFKNFDYLKQKINPGIDYKLFHQYFRRKVCSVIANAKTSIYISQWLKNEYDKEFHTPSCYIMTSSHLCDTEIKNENQKQGISYLGNLNVGRPETIVKLAHILERLFPEQTINVYGNASDEVLSLFKQCSNIEYYGFVSYEKCIEIMQTSLLLIHVEGFNEFFIQDSKYAFSTKIADSLACGTCLFVLAPEELTVTQYLESNDAACVVHTIEQAEKMLKVLLDNQGTRSRYATQARMIALDNHSLLKNREKFQKILLNAVNKGAE